MTKSYHSLIRLFTDSLTPRRRAFTLIETLVAIAIIACVLPIVLSGISLASRAGLLARQRTLAATLGEAKLNEIVATDLWQSGALSGDFGDDAPGFTWSAVVAPYNDTDLTNQNLQEIDLTVTWMSRNKESTVVLSTLVYDTTLSADASSTGGTQ